MQGRRDSKKLHLNQWWMEIAKMGRPETCNFWSRRKAPSLPLDLNL